LGLAVLIFVINLVRTRRLQERYALLWLLAGLGLTIAPLVIHWLDRLAYALGFDYPPALLLMLAVIGLLLIIFQLSLNISRNSENVKVLAQEVGLLRQEVEALGRRLETLEAASLAGPAGRRERSSGTGEGGP
jgi:hypothetical protein